METTQEFGTNAAVSVCQQVSEELNRHLTILGHQLANCQGCKLQMDCLGRMRLDRLAGGECHFREG